MNDIIQLFHINKKINNSIVLFSMYCLSLLLVRAKITQSVYLFFLLWNLVLAIIPYIISLYITSHLEKINKYILYILLFTWLAFIPNSFYIITDLVHVVRSEGNRFYFDLLLISSFAIIGFFIGLISIFQIENILKIKNFNPKYHWAFLPIISYLNGFGIYIGRVLRFNSWDILSNPSELFTTLFIELFSLETILFTFHFGTFILITYYFFKNNLLNSNYHDKRAI
jgi:uncharacterized membrane protein